MKSRISSLIVLLIVVASLIAPMLATTASAAGETWTLVTDASTLKSGDKIIIAAYNTSKGSFVAGDISSSIMASTSATFSSDGKTLTSVPSDAVQLTLGGSSGKWTLSNSDGKLLGATATKKVAWGSGTTTWSISIASNGDATIQNGTSSYGRFLYNVGSPRFTTYTSNVSSSMVLPKIYKLESACTHTNQSTTTDDATCTEAGSTTVTCTDCGETVSTETIPATGHNYVDGSCTVCGAKDPSILPEGGSNTTVTIIIEDYASANGWVNGTQYKTVTMDENIKVTAKGGTNTGKYYTSGYEWRIYQSEDPSVTVEALNGCTILSVKVTYNINNKGILTYGDDNITSGTEVTVNASTATFGVGNSESETNGQVKITKIEVTYVSPSDPAPDCEHTNTEPIGTAKPASCSETGLTAGLKCADCGHIIELQETIPLTDHMNVQVVKEGVAATCTTAGKTEEKKCSDCDTIIQQQTTIQPSHSYSDGVCTRCCLKEGKPSVWTLVTDLSSLNIGDKIIIVAHAADSGYALGTNQKTSNREAVEVTKNDNNVSFTSSVQELVLQAGTKDGTFALYTGAAGYLYASGSNSNGLKTQLSLDDNGSWMISISDNGVASIVAQGSNSRNVMQYNYNNGTPLFNCYSSASQSAIAIYKLIAAADVEYVHGNTHTEETPADCTTDGLIVEKCTVCNSALSTTTVPATGHVRTTTVTNNPADCTTDGSIIITCDDCGVTVSNETINAPGHNETFVVTKEPTCTSKGQHTYTCTVCDNERTSSDILPLPHDYVNDVCSVCGYINSASLNFSGEYVIAAIRSSASETTYRFMQAALTGSKGDKFGIIDSTLTALPSGLFYNSDYTESLVIFVLEKLDNGNYVIYAKDKDGDNYLGCGDDHSAIFTDRAGAREVTVEKTINGEYNIYFIDEDEIIYLAFNSNHNYQYAGWYSSNQIKNIQLVPFAEKAIISAANLNLKNDLTMNFYVVLAEGENISDYTMKFEFVGKEYFANTAILYDAEKRMYYFSLTEIAPQYMTENIRAELIDGDGNVVAVKDNYTVKLYAMRLIAKNPDNESLLFLLADMLRYGAAAQSYQNHKTDELATKGVSLIKYPEDEGNSLAPMPTDSDNNRELYTAKDTGIDSADYAFTAAGLKFDFDNKIFIKFRAVDVSKVNIVIKVDGVEVGNGTAPKSSADGIYIVYSDGISATKFDTVYTFELYVDGTLHQTLTYSVNSYAYAKQASTTPHLANLVITLYRYGLSAKAYNPAQ